MNSAYNQAPHSALTDAQIDIAVLQERYTKLEQKLDKVESTLEEVKTLLTEARGGWRVMMLLGGGAAALGGAISWAITHIQFR